MQPRCTCEHTPCFIGLPKVADTSFQVIELAITGGVCFSGEYFHALLEHGYWTIGMLLEANREQLQRDQEVSDNDLDRLEEVLGQHQLRLGMSKIDIEQYFESRRVFRGSENVITIPPLYVIISGRMMALD